MLFVRIPQIVILLSGILIGVGVVRNLISKGSSLGFSESVRYLLKRWYILGVCGVLFIGVYCGASYKVRGNLKAFRLKFNFEEAVDGLNPNGTRFNSSELLSDEVLSRVSEKTGLGVDVLKNCIYISTVYDETSINKENPKVATEYTIGFNENILPHSEVDIQCLSDVLAEECKNYYIENNAENYSILSTETAEISDLDYAEIDDKVEVEATKLKNFISGYRWDEITFVDESGETFSSLSQKIEDFIDIELERYRSFVLEKGLTKDRSNFNTVVDYKNRILQVRLDKQNASYDVRLSAIDMYDSQMARVVLVPTEDSVDEFYMSRTKIGVDYFADEANLALVNYLEIKKRIEENVYMKSKIKSSKISGTDYDKADDMVNDLLSGLEELSTSSLNLYKSYIDQSRQGYVDVIPLESSMKYLLNIKGAVIYGALFGLSLCYCMVSGRKKRVVECTQES